MPLLSFQVAGMYYLPYGLLAIEHPPVESRTPNKSVFQYFWKGLSKKPDPTERLCTLSVTLFIEPSIKLLSLFLSSCSHLQGQA